jgi:hypothetical protein
LELVDAPGAAEELLPEPLADVQEPSAIPRSLATAFLGRTLSSTVVANCRISITSWLPTQVGY